MQRAPRHSAGVDEPTNGELMARFNDLAGRMDQWIEEHRTDHRELETRLREAAAANLIHERESNSNMASHFADAAVRQHEIDTMAPDVAASHDVGVRLDTLASMVKLLAGGSLVMGILDFVLTIGHVASGGKLP